MEEERRIFELFFEHHHHNLTNMSSNVPIHSILIFDQKINIDN